MNFLQGETHKDDLGWYFVFADVKLRFPPEKVADLPENCRGKSMILGIRPEDIYDKPFESETFGNTIPGAFVEISELMGNEVYLYLNVKGTRMIARVASAASSRAGQTISAIADMSKVHLFDPETEETIIN
jgi:multiple sugar transport system ATP-binding protein